MLELLRYVSIGQKVESVQPEKGDLLLELGRPHGWS